MRVISQDGTIDIPYDSVIIQRFGREIYFLNKNLIGVEQLVSDMDIATYSTEEKAKKAMEMLRDAYQYGKRVAVPKFDESGIDKEDDITLYNTRLINDFFKGGTYVPTKVFQFPKDEDVEINNGLE